MNLTSSVGFNQRTAGTYMGTRIIKTVNLYSGDGTPRKQTFSETSGEGSDSTRWVERIL